MSLEGRPAMSDLATLIDERDSVLGKIREIEIVCEGLENEANAKQLQELNLLSTSLSMKKQQTINQLSVLEEKVTEVNVEITRLSSTGAQRILNAIKEQRWYFFKNKTKVLLDRDTGILWANLDYFPWHPEGGMNNYHYSPDAAKTIVSSYKADGYTHWEIPKYDDFVTMIEDRTFPFQKGDEYQILEGAYFYCDMTGLTGDGINLNKLVPESGSFFVIPCSKELIKDNDYEIKVSEANRSFNETERLQFTLDLFVQNGLLPVFKDESITDLYRQIYFEKPQLLSQLNDIQSQIQELQNVTLLSSEFDYLMLLSKYDVESTHDSVIKYYQAIQQWCDELLDKLDYYEKEKTDVIQRFNIISIKLAKHYDNIQNLSVEENQMLSERHRYLQKNFLLGMSNVKTKILAVKKQADDLEYRIDEIDSSENSLRELGKIEQEKRASFAFVAENTAKIVRNALEKIEFFETHDSFVTNIIDIWGEWTEGYQIFKTSYKDNMKHDCEVDGIDDSDWIQWYHDWEQIRFVIESKLQPLIERGLKGDIVTVNKSDTSVIEQLIAALDAYKKQVDNFFLQERKGIYQRYAFEKGGSSQEKLETERDLYKLTAELQSSLQDIIFNCQNEVDRIWILNLVDDLLDFQIDEILSYVTDNELKAISITILNEFAVLKQKNFDIYLADARAYDQAQSQREKDYNSLIFKMRKELSKQQEK